MGNHHYIAHLSHSENDNLNVGLGGNIGKSLQNASWQENFDEYYVYWKLVAT